MSFFSLFKKSLGLGEDTDDGLLEDSDEAQAVSDIAPVEKHNMPRVSAENVDVSVDSAKADLIFDRVVRVFNESLPSFLRDAVDPAAQRKMLYDGLDASLKEYIESLEAITRQKCEAQWAAEQSAMRNEMDNLRNKTKEIEQQRFEIKQQQLSADRQRRALNDRVHDLETQIANLEAEREQFDLENKSLVNKLKVAGVHETEADDLRAELNDARAEIARLRAGVADDVPAETVERIAALEAELAAAHESLEAAAEKDRIATEMFNGLQSKAASSREELEAKTAEAEQLKTRLAEAEATANEVDRLSEQMAKVEELIAKRDRKIAQLKESCKSLRSENDSLRQTISTNIQLHADAQAKLEERIAELEADLAGPVAVSDLVAEPEAEAVAEQIDLATPKISDIDLAAIEETFDSADWMRSDPPETPSMRTGVSEAEFGYQAPLRKPNRPDNDAQLSLF